jgi:hypothetical protein
MPYRPLAAEMRWLLRVASVLVLVAGFQLFVLSDYTDQYFAWTVSPPVTAAFLGAAFWGSFVLELLASRETIWARARIAAPAVLVFTTAMLIATLLHLDRFHLDSAFGWIWLAVYVVVPPIMLFALIRQSRVAGSDPAPGQPLAIWLRVILGVQAALMLVYGLLLFLAPSVFAPYWPWMLTPLTARATASWLLGLGVAAGEVARENDILRARIALASYTVLSLLELIVLLRYSSVIEWGDPTVPPLLVFLLVGLAASATGWRKSAAAIRSEA